jgi:predicted  nucleic acid-binding Zn-ribbon protein
MRLAHLDNLVHEAATHVVQAEEQASDLGNRAAALRGRGTSLVADADARQAVAAALEQEKLALDASRLEARAMDLLEDAQRYAAEAARLRERQTVEWRLEQQALEELAQAKQDSSDQAAQLALEITRLEERMPAAVVATIHRLLSRLAQPLARLDTPADLALLRRAHGCTCSACHMSVPVDQVALLLGEAERLAQCPNCQRVLWLEPDTRRALNAPDADVPRAAGVRKKGLDVSGGLADEHAPEAAATAAD